MQRFTFYQLLLIIVMSLLSACAINTQNNTQVSNYELGTNLVDESCQLKTGSMLYISADMPGELFNISCGDWEWPSARIFKVDENLATISTWLGDSAWRRILDKRMSCVNNEQSLPLLNSDMLVLKCKLNNGGWPYLAAIIQLNGSIYLADGIPSALVTIEKAIATLAGTGELPPSSHSAAIKYLQGQYKKQLYSSNDLQRYYRAMTLGQYYNSIKSFSKAETEYWKAINLHQQVLGTDNSDTGDALMHIALELSNQEQFARADDLFLKAYNKFNVTKSPDDDARFLSYQALHSANQGVFDEALTQAIVASNQRKEDIFTKTGSGFSPSNQSTPNNDSIMGVTDWQSASAEIVHSLYIEAAMHERLEQTEESKLALQRAEYILSMAAEAPPLWEPQLDSLAGIIATADQQQSEAEKAQTRALNMFEARAPRKRPTMLSLLDLGKLHIDQQRNDDALNMFRSALKLAAKRNNSYRLNQLEPFFKLQLKNDAVREGEQASEMFEAAQLVQGNITTKDIARTVARFGKKNRPLEQQDSPKKIQPISELIGKLQMQEYIRAKAQRQYQVELGRLLEQGHIQRLEKLTQKLENIDQEIEVLNQQVQTVSPGYRQLINSAVISEDVINALTKDEALLQILIGENQSYVFFIKDKNVKAYSVSIEAVEITKTVDLLRKTIAKRDREIIQAASKAYQLYDKLFAPVAAEINEVSHLITVPSGPLLSFPFGLFVTKPTEIKNGYSDAQLAKIAWLAKTTTISLVPSSQSFVYLRQNTKPSIAPKSLIAFGDFVPFTSDVLKQHQRKIPICQAIEDENDFYFDELSGTRKEIKTVASKFSSVSSKDLFLKTRFTEEAVKSQNLKDYRIIYFATHALLPDQVDCRKEPSLITSIDTQKTIGDDGFLTAGEITELDLDADLVVLSACNTGGAYKAQGESLTGLARSFFFAGARSLLVSHWSVEDLATADLMILVFDYLKKNPAISIAEALKMAQSKMINKPRKRNWAHPFYWAGFSLIGDGKLNLHTNSWRASL